MKSKKFIQKDLLFLIIPFVFLIVGTPLQNNILELLNLIEFICPVKAKTMKNYESLKMFLTTPNAQSKQSNNSN